MITAAEPEAVGSSYLLAMVATSEPKLKGNSPSLMDARPPECVIACDALSNKVKQVRNQTAEKTSRISRYAKNKSQPVEPQTSKCIEKSSSLDNIMLA